MKERSVRFGGGTGAVLDRTLNEAVLGGDAVQVGGRLGLGGHDAPEEHSAESDDNTRDSGDATGDKTVLHGM